MFFISYPESFFQAIGITLIENLSINARYDSIYWDAFRECFNLENNTEKEQIIYIIQSEVSKIYKLYQGIHQEQTGKAMPKGAKVTKPLPREEFMAILRRILMAMEESPKTCNSPVFKSFQTFAEKTAYEIYRREKNLHMVDLNHLR